jgi:hypothetical protein
MVPASRSQLLFLFLGLLAVAALAFGQYWSTTSIGFLLDDWMHAGQIYDALHGEPASFVRALLHGWNSVDDGLVCFRPGVDLSLLIDGAVSGSNPFGYHLSQLICLAMNCVLTGLVCFELAQLFSIRTAAFAGIAAALLFCCYPLHAETVAWVIGRVDGLCCLFYLLCMLFYLQYRTNKSNWSLGLSLASLAASLSCKEMAVTAPLAITLLEFSIPRPGEKPAGCRRSFAALKPLLALWSVLAGFAVLRTIALGTVIGGYGSGDKRMLLHALTHFISASTWWKVVFPSTDELPAQSFWLPGTIAGSLIVVAAICLSVARSKRLIGLFAFLAGWALLALLPTFQIFQIAPNLVGSRLVFISSAPLCMLIACAFAACADGTSKLRLFVATVVVSLIAVQWSSMLSTNLQPWLEAGRRMNDARQSVQSAVTKAGPKDKILFAALPADYKGAGLIARPRYLLSIIEPPFAPAGLANRVVTCERPLPGPSDYVYPQQLQSKIKQCTQAYYFDNQIGRFTPLHWTGNQSDLKWTKLRKPDGTGTFWFDTATFNPQSVQCLTVTYDIPPGQKTRPISLVWRSPKMDWWLCATTPVSASEHQLMFVPARLRAWTFADSITGLGLQGPSWLKIHSAQAIPLAQIEPKLSAYGSMLKVDATEIPGATTLRIYIARPGKMVSDLATQTDPGNDAVESCSRVPLNCATINLSEFEHAVVAVRAFDSHDKPLGILSEPLEMPGPALRLVAR